MNGRMQDPAIGRFISADPFVQEPFATQSHSRYSYVWNNPTTFIDPSGFEKCVGNIDASLNCYDDRSPAEIANAEYILKQAIAEKRDSEAATSMTLLLGPTSRGGPQVGPQGGEGDRLPQDLENYFDKASEGDWWGAVKAGLTMVKNSWADAYSTPERGVLTTMTMIPVVGVEANAARAAGTRFLVSSAGEAQLVVNGLRVSEHAALRMTERGVSISALEKALGETPFRYFHEGAWKTGFYDPTSLVFVGSIGGDLTTVIKATPKYIENLKKAAPLP